MDWIDLEVPLWQGSFEHCGNCEFDTIVNSQTMTFT